MRFSAFPSPKALSPMRRLHIVLWMLLGVVLLLCVSVVFSSRARVLAIRSGLMIAGAQITQSPMGLTNLLIVGTGDRGHDGADLTDTMIVASLDPAKTRSTVLLSLPRDLYIQIVGETAVYGRINTLFFLEKSRLQRSGLDEEEASVQALGSVGRMIGEKLGMEIHGVLQADFTAFRETVDALGGVKVTVRAPIVDYNYPLTETRMGTFRIGSGTQLLDGETALRYARSRYSTSDFDRSARQQQLLTAMGEQVRSLGRVGQITFLYRLYQGLQGHVRTTLAWEQILGLAQVAMELSPDRVIAMQLNYDIGGDGHEAGPGGFVTVGDPERFAGASVLIPFAAGGIDDWSRIRVFALLLTEERSLYLDPPAVQIRSVPAARTQAWRLRNELLRHGLTVLPNVTLSAEESAAQSGSLLTFSSGRWSESASVVGSLTRLPVEQSAQPATGSGDLLMILDGGYRFEAFGER